MRAHEVHGLAAHARGGQRTTHGVLEPATLRIRRCHVRAVTAARVAEQAAEPHARRVGVAREQHEGGALAQQQPAAPPVERPHALARERAQRVEAPHHEAAEHVVAAGHDEIGGVRGEQIGAHPHRRGARCARGGHGQHGAAGGQALGQRVRGAVVQPPGRRPHAALAERALALLDAAERGADDDGDARGIRGQRGARKQVVGGQQQQRGRTAARQAAVPERAQLLDLAAAPHAQVVDAEPLDR